MHVGERIRQVRKTLKLSQAEFARAIFISNGYIAELEGGLKRVNDRIIYLIAMTFGVSEEWLREGVGDMFHKPPSEKLQRMIRIFTALPPKFQDYVITQIEALLEAAHGE
ncbi:MAG: helix-turn-helix domain-containing protein [Treponema sp.]|jgi:transcriptional regulator with XRE-family HTH domain|nr:helix-turn-helix domain-containing protein [Treponema sp.]